MGWEDAKCCIVPADRGGIGRVTDFLHEPGQPDAAELRMLSDGASGRTLRA